MKMKKGNILIGMLLLLVLLVTCSVNVNDKLKDPDFINWLSNLLEGDELALGVVKKDGNFYYDKSNILIWKQYYRNWYNASEFSLIEETYYNEYGVAVKKILKSTTGKGVIAEKIILTSRYNPTQVTGIGYKYPDEKDKLFFLIDYQDQVEESETVSHIDMFLCIDTTGHIITAKKKPKFIDRFNVEQKTQSFNQYNGAFIEKTTTIIYPCKNCYLINKKIGFVW